MRTKTLLLTAALSFAGLATSMAQVYSVNSVGYINLTMKPKFNLIANQLNRSGGNTLNNLFSGTPVESQVFKFSAGLYKIDIYDGANWLDAISGDPSTTTLEPGEGAFFYNAANPAADIVVTLVGEVPQGNVSVTMAPNRSLISSKVPQAIALTAANGFPQVAEALYTSWDATTQKYKTDLINDGTQWLDGITGDPVAPATPAVGEGFFIYNPQLNPPQNMVWNRTFSVN